jgi:hypothetical protein
VADPKIVNLADVPWTPWSSGDGISVEVRDLAAHDKPLRNDDIPSDRAAREAGFKAGR